MRPTLRPGLQVLRRDVHSFQLGLDWPGIATLVDTEAIRTLLACVDGFRDHEGVLLAAADHGVARHEAQHALDQLIECGVLVDQAVAVRRDIDEGSWSSMWLLAGPAGSADDLVKARRACRLAVHGTGRVADVVRTLLGETDLRTVPDVAGADAAVIAADQEPSRDLADEVMHSGVPHLWATVRDLVGVVGPFVEPGRSACLRCVDWARAELDPSWLTLLDAVAANPHRVPPCDPLLAHLVGSWAAQELALFASGIRPQMGGSVIEIPYGFGAAQTQQFEPHPKCGCGWPVWRDTMGA